MADILNKLNSANYVTVKVTDNAIVNGNNLLAAYALAKTTSPNGTAKSATNRLAVILPAARYDLGTQSLILDTQYIDIVGSTSDRIKHYIISNVGVISRGTVQQTANNVKLYNLTIENSNTTHSFAYNSTDPAAYFPDSNLPLVYIENVKFLSNDNNAWSMRRVIEYSGTFKDCTGGILSFGGGGGTVSGTFTNCTGGNSAFGGSGIASGTFTNCTGAVGSFGGYSGIASGTFTNCTAGEASFGAYNGTVSGTFKDCTGGNSAFGGYSGIVSGTFKDCTAGEGSFGGYSGIASGTFKDCTGGAGSFGGGGSAGGTFKDCTGGDGSFGYAGTASGTFKDCTGGDGSFGGGGSAGGTFKDCTGGDGSFNL